jgi:nucleobase:cation symporter-1, NCS1 family
MRFFNVMGPFRTWASNLKEATSSKDAFTRYIRTEGNESGKHSWTNEDLKPSPPEMINWRWYNFCIFWFGMGFGNW